MARLKPLAIGGALLIAAVGATAGAEDGPAPAEAIGAGGEARVDRSHRPEIEAELKRGEAELRREYQEWKRLRLHRDQIREEIQQKRTLLASLESQRRVAPPPPRESPEIAARRARGLPLSDEPPPPGTPPPPPPEFMPPPEFSNRPGHGPPPMMGMHPEDMKGAGKDRLDRARQAQRLEHQWAQTWAQVVLARCLDERYSALVRKARREIRRRDVALNGLADELARAAREIDASPGSLGTAEDHKAILAKMAEEFLRGGGTHAEAEAPEAAIGKSLDVATLLAMAESFRRDLGAALSQRQARRHDAESRKKRLAESTASESRLAADLERAPAAQKEPIAAQLKGVRAQIKRLGDEKDWEEKTRGESAIQIAALRQALAACVGPLREAVDRAQRETEEPARDAIKDAGKAKKAPPITRAQRALVAEIEELIRVETVPLDPDKCVSWVDATLNGRPDQRMVLDPDAETIRISARSAGALGVRRAEDEPPVPVLASNGKTLSAAPARIATVRVGPIEAADVDCLILPEGYDAPPVLGASFLDLYASKVDAEGASLTITDVDVKPARPRAGATAKARDKKR